MESVFCFEIAIDNLTLKRRVKCESPYIAVAFLDFPTILIHLDSTKQAQANVYQFQKGKSCLFKISPTLLYQQLNSTEIFLIVLDKSSEKKCIGSSSFSLKQTIKEVIGDLQTNGIHKTSCHGATGAITISNFMHATVGHVDITYKLTSLGHSILPHLSAVAASKNEPPLVRMENHQKVKMPADNTLCPPPLFYVANSSTELPEKENDAKIRKVESKSVKLPDQSKEKIKDDQNEEIQEAEKKFLSVNTTGNQKCEATQTDSNVLEQYPVLNALVKEVLQLGFDRPTSAPGNYLSNKMVDPTPVEKDTQKRPHSAEHVKPKSKMAAVGTKKQKNVQKATDKKPRLQYPLKYGLTKSLQLRMEKNGRQDKHIKSPPKRKSKKISSKKLAAKKQTKFTTHSLHMDTKVDPKTSVEIFTQEKSLSEEFASEHLSVNDLKQTSTEEVVTVRDPGSPRALSRQSIEIRLPTATSSYNDDEFAAETSEKYKYSDDFDDDQISYERSTSALTNLESSPQNTGVELSTDFAGQDSPQRLSVEVSPQPTASDISLSPPFGATYLKSKPTHEFEEESVEVSPKSTGNLESPGSWKYSLPKNEFMDEGESKITDTSSSVATAMMTPILPVPPPSDSPVIRSLASEPPSRSKNPHPPSMSHSSSFERIRRKFKRSSDSFYFSDVSDVRTSDLADIKTSDISEFRSSEEFSTRLATQRYNASPPKPEQ